MDALNRIKFLEDRLHRLSEIGMALSTEKNTDRLFEMILEEAKNITQADGRTLYSINEDGNLDFEILRNDSMNTIMGGSSFINSHAQRGPNTASVNIIIPTIAEGVFLAPIVIKIKPKPNWKKPAKNPRNISWLEIFIFPEIIYPMIIAISPA